MELDARMSFKTSQQLDVTKLAHELYGAFRGDCLSVRTDQESNFVRARHHCLTVEGHSGGIVTIAVHLACKYYGEGHERGPIEKIIAIASWIEHNVSDAEVYYGADTGEELKLFDKARRQELWTYFCSAGHKPYGLFVPSDRQPPKCHFCGGEDMLEVSGGEDQVFYACYGCPNRAVVKKREVHRFGRDPYLLESAKKMDKD